MKGLSGLWRAAREVVHVYPLAGVSAVFIAGIVFWGGFNWTLELTNTESFCLSCHEMKSFVYPEYKKSVHYTNRTGVRASCPDCHVPRDWIHKVARKVRATNELFHWLRGTVDSRAKFEAKRLDLARKVWASMAATDSRECRNCHRIGHMNPGIQTVAARGMHELAIGWGKTCIDCHKGLAHSLPRGFDKEVAMDALHDRMAAEKVKCRRCHEGMAAAPPGEGWE